MSFDCFIQQEFLKSLCVVESNQKEINIQKLLEMDNQIYVTFNKNKDVSDKVIKSCMSTMANLKLLDENFQNLADNDEEKNEKCGEIEGMQPFINVLENRLFHMCIAHYKNNGISHDYKRDANILYEKLIAIVEAKVKEFEKK